ncbi:MAG: hypothetical protein IJ939_00440 [Clostridia bacterium]|nr:hypothetical protein [Clostridia bacterium]
MNLLNVFTVSFFGHRDFSEHLKTEPILENLLKDIIKKHEFVEFLVGRNGEFDQFVSSTIRKVKRDFYGSNSELVCVLPYETSEFENNKESFLKYYDRVELYAPECYTHFKAMIRKRNHNMILRSNYVICYVSKKTSGAYDSMLFANKNHVPLINLAEEYY